MGRIQTMLNDAFDDGAARYSDTTFVESHGAVVAARVRRRRRTRAVGGAGTAIAMVVGVGAVAFPAVHDTLVPATAPDCIAPPTDVDWWNVVEGHGDIMRGQGPDIEVALTTDELEISEMGEADSTVRIPVRDRQLEGTTRSDDILTVDLPSGLTVEVALRWYEDRINLAYEVEGDDDSFVNIIVEPPGRGIDAADPGQRYMAYPTHVPSSGFPASPASYTVMDTVTGSEVLALTVQDDGDARVEFADGTVEEFDAGEDGIATFDWVGVTTVQAVFGRQSSTIRLGDDAWSDVDAEVVGPEYCMPEWVNDLPSASTTVVGPTVTPSPEETFTLTFED